MINKTIPNIPKLNFKKENNKYVFKSDFGKLKSKLTGKECEIIDINIVIGDSINIYFDIDFLSYSFFFLECISNKKGSLEFSSPSKIKYFDIFCYIGDDLIELINFYETSFNITLKNNCDNYIFGHCEKFIYRKFGKRINKCDLVNIWNVLEYEKINQINFAKFKSNHLKSFYIKSINTREINISEENYELYVNIQSKQKESFNQLLDNYSFIFYRNYFLNQNYDDVIDNINRLLMFFSSNIIPLRMRIIEDELNNKLEVVISPKNSIKTNGKSIFKNTGNNFFDFLDSSYDKYINLKNKEIDIDLLFYYFVWIKNEQFIEVKLTLCSSFFEVLKNNKLKSSDNEKGSFFNKIKSRFELLELNTISLLEFFQNDVYKSILEIESEFLENYDNHDVDVVCKSFKEDFVIRFIESYRNKIIHSGRFKITNNDIDRILSKMTKEYKKKFSKELQRDLVEKFDKKIKCDLYNMDSLFDISIQSKFFESMVEIILLKYLGINCLLNNKFNNGGINNVDDLNSKKIH